MAITYCSFYFTFLFFLSLEFLTLDPPTYEQAIKVFERKFAPNYPVYRRQTSYSSQTNTPVLRRHCNPWETFTQHTIILSRKYCQHGKPFSILSNTFSQNTCIDSYSHTHTHTPMYWDLSFQNDYIHNRREKGNGNGKGLGEWETESYNHTVSISKLSMFKCLSAGCLWCCTTKLDLIELQKRKTYTLQFNFPKRCKLIY